MPNLQTYKLHSHKDHRGELLSNLNKDLGENVRHFFIATINPGKSRGNHYHKRKKEWFIILGGKAKIILTNVETKKTKEYPIASEDSLVYEMDVNTIHTIKNISKTPITLIALVNEFFDKEDPDTFTSKDL